MSEAAGIVCMLFLTALIAVFVSGAIAFDAGFRYGRKGLTRAMRRVGMSDEAVLEILMRVDDE